MIGIQNSIKGLSPRSLVYTLNAFLYFVSVSTCRERKGENEWERERKKRKFPIDGETFAFNMKFYVDGERERRHKNLSSRRRG